MYTVFANLNDDPRVKNSWPPTAKQIHRQGRPGKNPRPVIAVRVKSSCRKVER
jgi:hypothetical protein